MKNATQNFSDSSVVISNQTTSEGTGVGATTERFECMDYDMYMNVAVKLVLVSLGCVCNTLTVCVMWRERARSATAFLLITLAGADTLLLFVWLLCVTFPSEYVHSFLFQAPEWEAYHSPTQCHLEIVGGALRRHSALSESFEVQK